MAAFNTVGPQEKKTAAKLEKLRKENPEEVENLLKTVNVPSTGNAGKKISTIKLVFGHSLVF